MAHINAGRGLVIHRDNCPNLEELHHDQPDKLMPVTWAERPKGEFSAHLRIALENRRGLVANVANIITSAGGDLLRVTQEDRDAHSMALMIELGVHDRTHLASVVRKLKHIKGVHNIVRK
jgi:GTP pyrophosphokinase